MYITKYRTPARRSNLFFDDFLTKDFFGGSLTNRSAVPAANVRESKENFTIELAAPGMEKGDFNLKIEDDVLTISSSKKTENEVAEDRYTRKEFSYNAFTRAFSLPESVDAETISATYENGL